MKNYSELTNRSDQAMAHFVSHRIQLVVDILIDLYHIWSWYRFLLDKSFLQVHFLQVNKLRSWSELQLHHSYRILAVENT